MEFKQFVPSLVCLSCDGCCRFHDPASGWRPKLGAGEQNSAGPLAGCLDLAADSRGLDEEGFIRTEADQGQHRCRFLQFKDNTCQVYCFRPFECQLYPFLLIKEGKDFLVGLHLSCPFVQKFFGKEELEAYKLYLNDFLRHPEMIHFLRDNISLFGDYQAWAREWVPVFSLTELLSSTCDG